MRAEKLVRHERPRTPSRTPGPSGQRNTITVRLGRFGERVRELKLPVGTTIKDLVKAEGLAESSIRLKGDPIRLATQLKHGDLVVAVPHSIAGSGVGRYDHVDLDECRRTMSPRDFKFFVNFVGADVLGFRDEDLEPC